MKNGLALRPADPADKEMIFNLVNEKATRAAAFDKEPIEWKKHCQ